MDEGFHSVSPLPSPVPLFLSVVRVGNSGLLAVDESIASPEPESAAAVTTAAKPSVSKRGGSRFPAQGEPSLPSTRDFRVRCLEKERLEAGGGRLGAPEIPAVGNGKPEIGDQHRGQR